MSLYHYTADLVVVIDGDTIVADVDLGFRSWIRGEHFRLAGINCPELPTPEGTAAKAAAAQWFAAIPGAFPMIYIATTLDRTEKYGRMLATVYHDVSFSGESVNDYLVRTGHAVRYP